jgi:hypothetical protein
MKPYVHDIQDDKPLFKKVELEKTTEVTFKIDVNAKNKHNCILFDQTTNRVFVHYWEKKMKKKYFTVKKFKTQELAVIAAEQWCIENNIEFYFSVKKEFFIVVFCLVFCLVFFA